MLRNLRRLGYLVFRRRKRCQRVRPRQQSRPICSSLDFHNKNSTIAPNTRSATPLQPKRAQMTKTVSNRPRRLNRKSLIGYRRAPGVWQRLDLQSRPYRKGMERSVGITTGPEIALRLPHSSRHGNRQCLRTGFSGCEPLEITATATTRRSRRSLGTHSSSLSLTPRRKLSISSLPWAIGRR